MIRSLALIIAVVFADGRVCEALLRQTCYRADTDASREVASAFIEEVNLLLSDGPEAKRKQVQDQLLTDLVLLPDERFDKMVAPAAVGGYIPKTGKMYFRESSAKRLLSLATTIHEMKHYLDLGPLRRQ